MFNILERIDATWDGSAWPKTCDAEDTDSQVHAKSTRSLCGGQSYGRANRTLYNTRMIFKTGSRNNHRGCRRIGTSHMCWRSWVGLVMSVALHCSLFHCILGLKGCIGWERLAKRPVDFLYDQRIQPNLYPRVGFHMIGSFHVKCLLHRNQ